MASSNNPYSGLKRPYSEDSSSTKYSSSSAATSTSIRGECYAVPGGRKPGIYFTIGEARNYHSLGQSIKSFAKIADAKTFMRQKGFRPIESGGWITNDKRPILYYDKKQQQQQHQHSNPSAASGSTTTRSSSSSTNRTPASASTSPKSLITIDSSSSQEEADSLTSYSPVAKGSSSTPSEPSYKKVKGEPFNTESSNDGKTEFHFDEIQQEAIDAAFLGKSVFITGVAGTGKSAVTRAIVKNAQEMRLEIAACAPTGVAAVNLGPELGAQTIHSLAGCGVAQSGRDFKKLLTRFTAKRWKTIEMLIIDEIGMLNADFLDWLDAYVRKARKAPLEPFGGIQLICVGDFAQLGPIPGDTSLSNRPFEPSDPKADCFLNLKECNAYAFQTAFWREAQFHHVHLKKVYRQSDLGFVQSLMDIRQAKRTPSVDNLIRECATPLEEREELVIPEGIKPTILYCTNRNVDAENFQNLNKLNTPGKSFLAKDSVEISSDVTGGGIEFVKKSLERNNFFTQCSASKVLDLKVEAQVMLLKNLDVDKGLVNGSRGVVKKFQLVPVVRSLCKKKEERLIGPSDIDKFPGCTFEQIKYNQKAEFDGKTWRVCRFEKYPLVQFLNGETRVVLPERFERVLFRQGTCIRQQLPLRLAWALTIHKSQGATLDLVICDLKGCFCSGQAYVALSRARTMIGLQIKNFSHNYVKTDPLVDRFYEALDGGERAMNTFLEEEAGLWWFPILRYPSWLRMFTSSRNRDALESCEIFRDWLQTYHPVEGYSGWGSEHFENYQSKAMPSVR